MERKELLWYVVAFVIVVGLVYLIVQMLNRFKTQSTDTDDIYEGQYVVTASMSTPLATPQAAINSFPKTKFVYFNSSTAYSATIINSANTSVRLQTEQDFAPYYGYVAEFSVDNTNYYDPESRLINKDIVPIFVVASGEYAVGDGAAAAYHSIQLENHAPVEDTGVPTTYKLYSGQPYIVIYSNNVPSSAFAYVLSHEILETLVNPNIGNYVAVINESGNNIGVMFGEVCDPIQMGTVIQRSYTINNNRVSNFVLPAWFSNLLSYRTEAEQQEIAYDILHVFTKPFQIIPSRISNAAQKTHNEEEEEEGGDRKLIKALRVSAINLVD